MRSCEGPFPLPNQLSALWGPKEDLNWSEGFSEMGALWMDDRGEACLVSKFIINTLCLPTHNRMYVLSESCRIIYVNAVS